MSPVSCRCGYSQVSGRRSFPFLETSRKYDDNRMSAVFGRKKLTRDFQIQMALILRWILCCCAVTTGTPFFGIFQASGPLFKVLVNRETVYVGGRNFVYQISNLTLHHKLPTGPISDDPNCPPEPEACSRPRHGTNDDTNVLLLFPTENAVLSCGNVRQGMCRMHSAVDITKYRTVGVANNTVNYVGGSRTTVAFFADGDQQSLITGVEYDGRPLKFARHSISSRILRVVGREAFLEYTHHSSTAVSALDLKHPRYKQQHRVRYVYGFSQGGFSYFLTTQEVAGTQETRLGRVCQADPTFFSYTELPIRCRTRTDARSVYEYATAAFLGSNFGGRNDKFNSSQLFIAFSKKEANENMLSSKASTICSFSITSLDNSFLDAARACFLGEPRTHLIEPFHGEKTPCVRDVERSSGQAYKRYLCDYGRNRYVEGNRMLDGRFRAHIDFSVSSLLVIHQWNSSVAFLGTEMGDIHKFLIDHNRLLYSVSIADIHVKNKAVQQSSALSQDETTAYFLSGQRLVSFPVGSCRPYGDCASCLRSRDPLNCGWCVDHCAHLSECHNPARFTQDTCPPVLKSVSPLSGPIDGGTMLTLNGQNFGSSQAGENGWLMVTAAGQTCHVVSWKKEQIVCKTGRVATPGRGPIYVNVTDRSYEGEDQFDMIGDTSWKEPFRYLVPMFLGFRPSYGPSSGGTNISIAGENLDSGSIRKVIMAGKECRIWRYGSRNIECTTSSTNQSETGSAMVCIDDGCLVPKTAILHQFSYRPDPEVTSIFPNATTISGGVVLVVSGKNLNSVEKPHLIVKVSLKFPVEELEISQACRHTEGEQIGLNMLCPTPALHNLSLRGLEATGRVPVSATVDFQMDGVFPLRTLPPHQRLKLSQLLYYPDPTFYLFPEEGQKVFLDETEICLKGKDLRHTEIQTEVILEGEHRCNVTEWRDHELTCQLPADLPELREHSLVTLEVRAGKLRFPLGNLHFVERPLPPSTPTIAGVVASVIVVALILMLAMTLYLRRRLRKKKPDPRYMVAYNAQAASGAPDNVYAGLSARLASAIAASSQATGEDDVCEMSDETKRLLEADNILITRERLKLGQVIGQGHFGCVYKGELTLPNKEETSLVAVKTLHSDHLGESRQDLESFLQEGLLMKDFHHHNVLTLIGVCLQPTPMVVLPYMMHGDLLTYLRDEQNQPTVRDLFNFAAEIAEGMRYLAELKFIHRDLAARNCMLDENMTVKVADFGLSKDVYEREYYRGDNKKSKLPVKWMAPESLEKGTYSTKTDVWSYGVVLWELMTRGVTPYPDVDNWDIVQFLKQGRRMLQPSYCPNLLYELMLKCWDDDPTKRPTFAQLLEAVQRIIQKLEQKSKKRVVGLDVTYVNYPLPQMGESTTSATSV